MAMEISEYASGRLVMVVVVFMSVVILASGQQDYNNVTGYECTPNADHSTCSAFAYYRTQRGRNATLATTATLFNTSAEAIANASSLKYNTTMADRLLADATPLIVPLSCGCYNATYQALTTYTVVENDTMAIIANSTFEGLVTYQAIMASNPTIVPRLMQIAAKLRIPVRCACPTDAQVAAGTESLLSYAVYPNEELASISAKFNASVAEVQAANSLPNSTIDAFSTLLVPLKKQADKSAASWGVIEPHHVQLLGAFLLAVQAFLL